VVGTAFPHLLKSAGHSLPWEHVILWISGISLIGGVLMILLVPDGPYAVVSTGFNSRALTTIFRSKDLRSASFGYFGHMWELYTLWAFFPVLISAYAAAARQPLNVPFWSFCVIAVGSLGCIGGGIVAEIGQLRGRLFSTAAVRALLPVVADFVSGAAGDFFGIPACLGRCSGRRLTAVFSPDGPDRPPGTCRIRPYHRYQYRIFHHDHQHPVHHFFD